MKKLIYTFLVLMMILPSAPSFGWGAREHAAIAIIAERHLTPTAKAKVDELLDGKSMEYYASWLDKYRKQMLITYVNRKGETKTRTIPHTMRADKKHFVVERPRTEAISIICESIEQLKDYQSLNDSTRLAAMQCIIHLVGDIHCPSHVRFADKLAKAPKVMFYGKKMGMHRVWDSALLRKTHPGKAVDLADAADITKKKQIKRIQAGTPYDWGQDIINRISIAWPVEENQEIGDRYVKEMGKMPIDQIRRAGLRLAKVMNDLFN